MRSILLYTLTVLLVLCTGNPLIAQNPTQKTKAKVGVTQNTQPNAVKQSYASEAEKYAADGLTVPGKTKKSKTTTSGKPSNSLNNLGAANTKSSSGERCSTNQALERRLLDPVYKEYRKQFLDKISTIDRQSIICDANNSVIIPIAVHFDASFTCANTQCLIDATAAQIQVLNDDFAALNTDLVAYTNALAACGGGPSVATDGACLTFCLANQNHPAASGLTDGQPAITVGEYTGGFGSGGGGAPEWPGYLNVFATAGGAGGVADGIPGALNGDGVTVSGVVFGGPNFGPCSSGGVIDDGGGVNWDLGRTLTHEVGHYLGIYHVWGDVNGGGCAGDDMISDTPDQAAPSGGCTTDCATLAACNPGEFVQYNFMDYFDDACLVMFSEEQAIVMNTFSNNVTWANDVVDTGCSDGSETSLAACALTAAFNPPNNTDIVLCTDDGTTIQFEDLSTNGPVSWDWTFAVTGGDITLSSGVSTMQNPAPMVTGGTSGTIDVTLTILDAGGVEETVTQSYTVTLVSGDACPNECDYTLELTDSFGDGWNGATLEILSNGVPVAGSPFGTGFTTGTSEINTVTLTDGETIDFNQINGGFPGEEGFTLTDPFGNVIFNSGPDVGAGVVYTFDAYCSAPTCDDGLQNGEEGGVDCGGTSPCPDCCSNGVQDNDETGVDCGGFDCAPCPSCEDGFTEIVNETFDTCAQPAGWTVTATDGGTGDITFTGGPADVPGGLTPSPDFAGCIAIINDDANDAIGIGCIISPVINIGNYISTSLVFDWQNNDFIGTGDFVVEVYDGTMWVQVFIEEEDNFGTNQTVDLSAYTNADFQIRFCYDDEGGFAWGIGIDNVAVCGLPNDECPTDITANDISGDYCTGTDATLSAAPNNPNASYAWSSSNPAIALSSASTASTGVALVASTPCTVESADISLVVTCLLDGIELFNGVVSTVNVYPAPPADLTTLVVLNENTCNEPVLVDPNCIDFVTLTPDAGNPTFPVAGGVAGTATYALSYASPAGAPECCITPSGDELVIGGAGASGNEDGDLEIAGSGGASGWTSTSSNFGSVYCDTGSCGGGAGSVNYGLAPNSGSWLAWFGGAGGALETGTLETSVTIPVCLDGGAEITFGYENSACGSAADFIELSVDGTVLWSDNGDPATCDALGAVTLISIDLSAYADGAAHTILFASTSGADGVSSSNFTVDNVMLSTVGCSVESLCDVEVSGAYDCMATEEVPTVGEWGLIILGLLMSIVAIVGIRERRITIQKS